MEEEDFPLARSRVNRPVKLPEKAAGFAVYRVPSEKGGAPRPILDGVGVLEIQLGTSPEELERMVLGQPGRYRLDVIDDDGNPLDVSCWYMIREGAGQGGASVGASADRELVRQLIETNRLWAESNKEVTAALSGVLARIGGLPPLRQQEGRGEEIREAVEAALEGREASASPPTNPEDTAKTAQNVKIWVDTLAESAPKIVPLIQAGAAALKKKP